MIKFEKVSYEVFEKDFKKFFTTFNEETKEMNEPSSEFIRGIYDKIELPKRSTKNSAGYDFKIPFDISLEAGFDAIFPTGIKCQMDDNVVLMLYPRSSLGFMFKMRLDNTVGVIDADYYNNEKNEGHIVAKITNDWLNDKQMNLKAGTKFMQGIFINYLKTVDDDVTEERVGGIGSTNKEETKNE